MTHHRKRLDRTSVLLGARQVLDETGLDGFTTRALAAHLQVQQPGLYWHFRTKAELLAALASDVLDREHHASFPESDEKWDAFLLRNARSFRHALHAVRDGARLHAEHHRRPSGDDTDEGAEASGQQVGLLVSQGFDEQTAISMLIAVSRYTVGVVLEEQTAEVGNASVPERDREFDFGLTALIDGFSHSRTASLTSSES
ncbi:MULTISPECIES: TetR/AcrR family transcriptional regulator C-terminal domain-containing protein [Actinomycetes]|jgi:TetR/AcrR family transcriptional regulator, tetracycline repressor protein|uniref:TetR/AcrR family tetracycline transcriptional repressor n=4 Tax=Actinomycetes TaxID=1760 RepID=A0A923E661_9ACTO|nr:MULTISPECIES: TetR/AcrR family transcriptional regulator C-terminal domain-containing protein [Actinomycetes]MBM7092546.1 TetR/AcrR family transcriptional regulator C-terminal domain-containing protein [Streptomyces sp. S12]UTT60546.1 TetR/AcrR family transcriptional regulator C-terminal domain-containing protein [Cellulosimicrobium cellulans]AAD25064.1 tetracycline repressor protein TetR [Corynebacterium glutamicum]KMY22609.1 TetR family transcriptional regulator [Actinobaculum suis]MBB633